MSQASSRFQALYEELHDKMLKTAYHLIGSIDTAEDLVQEAFLLGLFRQDELLSHPLPEGWLMQTLKNLALNERRRMQNHTPLSVDELFSLADKPPDTPLEDILPTKLSPQDRDVLIWRFEQDLSYAEIANRLGISETGCRSRAFRAIRRCKELLEIP